jgi:hypothetical protein
MMVQVQRDVALVGRVRAARHAGMITTTRMALLAAFVMEVCSWL